ncbi:MAG: hypothetical protein V1906_02315 [Candidatus Woesearchaeota archaeon]
MTISDRLRKAMKSVSLATLVTLLAPSAACVSKLGEEIKMGHGTSDPIADVRTHIDDPNRADNKYPINVEADGVRLDADGQISDDERRALKKMFYNWEIVRQDDKRFRMLASDLNIFASQRMKAKGLKWKGLGDLSLYTTETRDDMKRAFDNCTMGTEKLPDAFSAFYCDGNREITQPESEMAFFIPTFFHEWGHDQNSFYADEQASEFPAEANRIWMTYNSIGLDKEVGTKAANGILLEKVPGATTDVTINGMGKYNAAALAFYMAANKYSGDLDKAADLMFNSSKKTLKKFFNDKIKEHPNMNAREIWIREISQMLNSDGYRKYMNNLINRDNSGQRTEADELVDYMKIKFQDALIVLASNDSQSTSALDAQRRLMIMDFVDKGHKKGFHNEKFMNRTVGDITPLMVAEAKDNYNQAKHDEPGPIFSAIATLEKVIELNEKYPCKFDEFKCTGSFAVERDSHLGAYLELANAYWKRSYLINNNTEDKEKAMDVFHDFLDKFYPRLRTDDGLVVPDYSFEKNGEVRTKALLNLVARGNLLADELAYDFQLSGDADKSNYYHCQAKEFARIYTEASCKSVDAEWKRKECYEKLHLPESFEAYMEEQSGSTACVE